MPANAARPMMQSGDAAVPVLWALGSYSIPRENSSEFSLDYINTVPSWSTRSSFCTGYCTAVFI